jgi:hypothetical protein
MRHRPQRSRGQLHIATSLVLVAARVVDAAPNVPFGFELHTVERVHQFRAFGRQAKKDQLQKVQLGWVSALRGQCQLADENDLISMAENIVSDTEVASSRKSQRKLGIVSVKCSPQSSESPRSIAFGSLGRRARFLLAIQRFRLETCKRGSVAEVRLSTVAFYAKSAARPDACCWVRRPAMDRGEADLRRVPGT